jgi:hypothetical protein
LNTTGIILDGTTKVGTFDDMTVGTKLRQLRNVCINEQYVDVVKGQTNRDLLYLFVMQQDMSMVILECVGLGMAYGDMWCKPPHVVIEDASFVQMSGEKDAN